MLTSHVFRSLGRLDKQLLTELNSLLMSSREKQFVESANFYIQHYKLSIYTISTILELVIVLLLYFNDCV